MYLQMYELFLKTGNVPFAFRFFVVRGGYFLRQRCNGVSYL